MELTAIVLGSIAAAALPAFLVLYFLKRRHETVQVPSTKLWREALSALHADRPWQRLRTSLLFFLQLAAILLLVFAAFRPVTKSDLPEEMVVVIDCSGSMQATDTAPSRFEAAREEARKILSALPPGGRVTLIAAGAQPTVLASRTADRMQARDALDALRPDNGFAALDEALQLAASIRRETGAGLAVLSDRLSGGNDVNVGNAGANRAVETLAASRVGGELQALTVIKSYGFQGTVTAELSADGRLVDAREVDLSLDESAVIYWTDVPQDASRFRVRLTGADALALDDRAHCVVSTANAKKALLVSDRNVFLEAVLKLREDMELYRLAPADAVELKGYDLYVFDGELPEKLPADGSVIAFQPGGAQAPDAAAGSASGVLSAATGMEAAAILKNVNVGRAQIAKGAPLTLEGGWLPVAWAGGKPIIAVKQDGGRRLAVFGFDLHDSNLPLLKEFPILMGNLLAWELSDVTGGVLEAKAGGDVPLLPHALSAKIVVTTPSGKAVQAAPPFPAAPFATTDELGVYEVRQYGQDGAEIADAASRFAVNALTASESDLRVMEAMPALPAGETAGLRAAAAVNWWLLAAAAALLLMAAEWLVIRYAR